MVALSLQGVVDAQTERCNNVEEIALTNKHLMQHPVEHLVGHLVEHPVGHLVEHPVEHLVGASYWASSRASCLFFLFVGFV